MNKENEQPHHSNFGMAMEDIGSHGEPAMSMQLMGD
jgi:hypothetical protein